MKFLFIFLIFNLISCAIITKEDCNTINWESKGEQDASEGESISRFSKYQETCKEHGINISKENYVKGHRDGLKRFCTYKSGYQHGEQGSDPFTECDQIGYTFSRGYEEGFQEYQRIKKKKILEQEQEASRKKAIESILSRYNSKECSSSFDCHKDGDCRFNKCRHDNSECNFNSDCKIEGSCSNESEYVYSINQWVSVNVCRY